jgi:hypothetical protein
MGESTYRNATFQVLILGDIDGDGDIDGFDAALFRQSYIYEYNPKADLNFDGKVNVFDAALFRQSYITYR